MLSSLKQYFYNPLCFNCGSLFVEEHLFCKFCFESEIQSRMDLKERIVDHEGKQIRHFYLFDWVPGESDLLSSMVYQLKSDRCVRALRFYAKVLILEVLSFHFEDYNCVLPLPGSKKSSSHSYTVADQISQVCGLPIVKVLQKMNLETQQKKLSLQQRKLVEIKVGALKRRELFTTLKTDKLNPIYVDDILTTGNTLKASIKALAVNQNPCVLTLFYRPTQSLQLQ